MDIANLIGIGIIFLVCFAVGKGTSTATIERLKKVEILFKSTLKNFRSDGATLPSLIRWSDMIQEEYDKIQTDTLIYKKRPAIKSAEKVAKANKEKRLAKKEFNLVRNQLDIYEALAPWIADQTTKSIDELLTELKQESPDSKEERDPARKFLSPDEWKKLPVSKRNQLALDRFLDPNRKKSLWQIGIDFERYVGHLYEQEGYIVKFHGAVMGMEDLGIDLICTKNDRTLAIQCKRLSAIKEIPVRENVVSQIYGASKFLEMAYNYKNVTPMIITSYILSEQAKRFAQYLGVRFRENLEMQPYPIIKCNVSPNSKEKIYHLPMDQQYDKIIIGDQPGECYVSTVSDAEKLGFRRAFKWSGSKTEP